MTQDSQRHGGESMTPRVTVSGVEQSGATSEWPTRATRLLLACGVVAGPLYVVVGLAQALTRDGFDLRRHELSLLANGPLGWIQIANLLFSGLLVVADAIGMRRVLHPGRGGTWGPRLVGIYGVGLIAAGIFVADPAYGFPAGTPAGPPEQVNWHGILHFVVAGLGFLALIAACLVVARRFAAVGQRGWAAYSVATGVAYLAAFAGIATGSGNQAVNVAFGIAVLLGWGWVSAVAARLTAGLPAASA